MKKYTSKQLIKAILENPKEGRKEWMIENKQLTSNRLAREGVVGLIYFYFLSRVI